MKNWTIAKRIIAGGSLLLGLLILVGAIGGLGLKKIEDLAVARLQQDAVPGMVLASTIGMQTMQVHIFSLMADQAAEAKERDAFIARANAIVPLVTKAMQDYEGTITVPEDRANLEKLKKLRADYAVARENYYQLLRVFKTVEAEDYLLKTLDPAFAAYRDQTDLMLKFNQTNADHATSEIIQTSVKAVMTALVTAVVSVLAALLAGWLIIRGVNRALQQMATVLDDASGQVASAAAQVSSNSQSLAEGASEQAASLEETSSSLEELSSMTGHNADNAQSAKQLSGETRQAAEVGNTDMAEMHQAMNAIKTSSNDIAKIIKTIDEIAFQTNILALNAAVEAARAGEAGAGFAVVAEEVRALAQRSASSARETASKIEVAIQNGDQGVLISEKVARSLGVIVEKARKVDELVGQIAGASQEQKQGIGQINTAVSQMDKVTQTNAGNAEETAAASEELSAQAFTLKEAVGNLRQLVGGGQHQKTEPAATPRTSPGVGSSPKHRVGGLAEAHAGANHPTAVSLEIATR